MASTNSSSVRQNRPPPFAPKRPLSQSGSMDETASIISSSGSVARFPSVVRATTPLASNPPTKKYKAAVTTESRVRTTSRPQSSLGVPGTPKKNDGSRSRSTTPLPPASPRTPRTPKKGVSPNRDSPRPASSFGGSEMDVSVVDPEQVLVDYQNVDVDLSAEIDDAYLKSINHGKEDKVLVSIRVRPTERSPAWSIDPNRRSIKISPTFAKSNSTQPQEFHFDEIMTGSDNKPVYNAVARSHVSAAMDGYNSVIFAYGQTASGKTFTLTGDEKEPGIIPRAMKDVFSYIRRTPSREYLLRCSYLEIYNEVIYDLLCPPSSSSTVNIQGAGDNVILTPLREEVVISLKGVKEVIDRGYANRRTASTDWNDRSSRSHSVFRMVIESRERGTGDIDDRSTPSVPPTPGGSKLQAKGGRSVQTSVLSLIDLAGSEKATSDKDRTREGKYINTSLLTLGSVISTLVENSSRGKNDHIPYRNSKLTRMLQPSLSGNARISVICTINPEPVAVAETTSTLLFAQRVKRVQLNAKKKEVVDTDALLERYRKEIEDLKRKLAEREVEAPVRNRRLSSREQNDESRAMNDLQSRIQQLTKLILTSQTVDEMKGDESRPTSPAKVDFDLSPYQLQQELLAARRQIETQATQILSLEAALLARPELPADAPENEKDRLIAEQTKTIRELEIVVHGYEDNLGEPLRAVKEDVEKEWSVRLDAEVKLREEKEAWAEQLVLQLEKEKQIRMKLEEERQALTAFVSKFDTLGTSQVPARLRQPIRIPSGASAYSQRRKRSYSLGLDSISEQNSPSPIKIKDDFNEQFSLLDQTPDDLDDLDAADASFELKVIDASLEKVKASSPVRAVLGSKENIPL